MMRQENLARHGIGFSERVLLSFSSLKLVTWPKRAHTMLPRAHNTAKCQPVTKRKEVQALHRQSVQFTSIVETQKPAETEDVIVDSTAPATSSDGLDAVVRSTTAPGAAAVGYGRRNKSAATAALLGRAPRQERVQRVLRV